MNKQLSNIFQRPDTVEQKILLNVFEVLEKKAFCELNFFLWNY